MRFSVYLLCALVLCMAAQARDYSTDRRVVYAGDGGKKCRMTLYLPTNAATEPRPAVLLIHGGGWMFGTRGQLGWYGRRLAENGYVAASINYRMMPKYSFPACLHDCKAGIRWLRKHADELNVDPGRIAALGDSAGGHLAALLATTKPADGLEGDANPGYSSEIQAAVVLYGVADLSYYRRPKGYVKFLGFTGLFMDKFVGPKREDGMDPVELASPVTYADRDTCPVFFSHGLRDNWVPYGQSVAFRQQLQRLGVPTRLVTAQYGHAFDFFHPRIRTRLFESILAFLETHLGTEPTMAGRPAPLDGDPSHGGV
ncbi:MAG: alpha/beta hydrolase fold domain-containing protein [Nitrospiraceae bacterium]|nr:alpha/beta hydrolase fold domain-containing protein [Nitrospiraceae bacterium]